MVNQVYVSTDAPLIAQVATDYGASIIHRPPEFATDTASSESALLHALETIEKIGIQPELVVFLQCTSPLRTTTDIDLAIQQLRKEEADSLLSVSPYHRFLWHQINGIAEPINYDYRDRKRRQDMNPQYVENGSIFIFKPWVLKQLKNRLGGKISLFPMSEAAAHEIDSPQDLEIVEFLMKTFFLRSKNDRIT
jgi:N-acylneuraminate cytidylyltransferase